MARRNPRREARIASVRAAQRAAGKKVSRLKTRKGIDVSRIDPRVSWAEVQAMSAPQLRAYERRLNTFTSRSTGFVAGVKGTPLTGSLADRYKKLERQFNAKVRAWNASIADLSIAGTGLTVGQRREMLATSKFPRAGGAWKTMQEFNRSLRGVTGNEGLQKLIADMQQRLKPGFAAREMKSQRVSLEKMLRDVGDDDVWDQVKTLSNRQLQILVDETDFMTNVSYRYKAKQGGSDSFNDDVYGTAGLTVRSLAAWAKTIPEE